MSNEDGSIWLVFNGEIYNYIELASGLRGRGHAFSSGTDGEVILHLYEDVGPDCVKALNGMFAFVLWDSRARVLIAARDRIGIKPLYFHLQNGLFACASEAKSLLVNPMIPTSVDYCGLADYFFAGAPLARKTLFAGVEQLPPAHIIVLTDSGARIERYWDVAYRYNWARGFRDTVADVGELVDDAVRMQCRSDAPVGAHLSGGLDSSLVGSLTARHKGIIDVFSVRFDESAYYDEFEYASAVAQFISARHHTISPGAQELLPLLGSLTWHQDFPTRSAGGFSYFCVSRLAAASVKVALTGHGGDEVFGGYPAQFQATFGNKNMFDLSKLPLTARPTRGKRFARLLRHHGLRGVARRILQKPRVYDSLETRWIDMHGGVAPARNPLLHPAFVRRVGAYSPAYDYIQPFINAPTDQTFDRCLYHDLVSYLPQLLMKEDRASMAVSLESRVPLLDHRIVEYMATVPAEHKVPGRIPKAVLREVAAAHLPARVVQRNDKTPFPVPLQEWIAVSLAPQIRTLLGSEASLDRGVFHPRVLRDSHLSPQEMLAMLNVEVWFRVFIDRDPAWLPASGVPRQTRQPFAGLAALPS